MNKTAIKNFSVWARRQLISDVTYRAGMLGITEAGIASPLPQSTSDLQFFDIGTGSYAEVSGKDIFARNALASAVKNKAKEIKYAEAFQYVMEEIAYTWFNRLVAVRFMEVNDYLPSHVRVLSSANPAKLEPDMVTTPFETDMDFSDTERNTILQMKDENRLDELFRFLFIKQCEKLGEILPELFEQTNNYTELLLNISFTNKDGVVYHLTHDISEDDFNVKKEGQVEIIGWLYQYYNTEPKDAVFAALKNNQKITKEKIPAATQIFTPDWIVRYMVENSLGRLWHEGHSDFDKSQWKYYLDEAEQEPEVESQLVVIREEHSKLYPEDIKIIDPCMGSGHILVYAFDVLMQIYLSQGYTQRDAAKSILQNNLFGIDIDTRAYQLAYFAVMMKARQYNKTIFKANIMPNLMAVKSSPAISRSVLKRLGACEKLGNRLMDDFTDAEEYGSILNISYSTEELEELQEKLNEISVEASFANFLEQAEIEECSEAMQSLIRQAQIMGQKYDVVVTNPPYMGASGMSAKLADFVREHYPNSKSDMSTVCMEKTISMCKPYGYMSMINIPVWMFITSYESLRLAIINDNTIISMVHPGRGIFGSDFGSTAFVIQKSHIMGYSGEYRRLFKSQVEVESVSEREKAFLCGIGKYKAKQEKYKSIPGMPISYWTSEKFISAFSTGHLLGELIPVKKGMDTGDNDLYLKLWFEIEGQKLDLFNHSKKWVPYDKGGDYRKWFGNNSYVLNWENDGFSLKHSKANLRSINLYFRQSITWNALSAGNTCFRASLFNGTFDSAGSSMFPSGEKMYFYLGLMCSKISQYYLNVINPTINYGAGSVAMIPVIDTEEQTFSEIDTISKECVALSKTDWDSFETSWDFAHHPMLPIYADDPDYAYSVESFYNGWAHRCEDRFNRLKYNEEELNRIFIDIYGLQDELSSEVEDKDVTVRKADLQRDIKSLISYAVGCMFGRYNLGRDGLAFAGGAWNQEQYRWYQPDVDNCIPITDTEYFGDDIVCRFVDFIRKVYGERSLEDNLDFIAQVLGNKGVTSREAIRNYFLNDFFKDHCQTYSVTGSGKRPIYWLFDSGKQNGFKALVYMHRWNADTIGNVRVEYLHRMQKKLESEIDRMDTIIETSGSNRDIAAAEKQKEKLKKQQKECSDYDAKIGHLANFRIDIDLDDGVKANYKKVQTDPTDGSFYEILADSKDIMPKEKKK